MVQQISPTVKFMARFVDSISMEKKNISRISKPHDEFKSYGDVKCIAQMCGFFVVLESFNKHGP